MQDSMDSAGASPGQLRLLSKLFVSRITGSLGSVSQANQPTATEGANL